MTKKEDAEYYDLDFLLDELIPESPQFFKKEKESEVQKLRKKVVRQTEKIMQG